jgi:DNA topoisomerase-1
MPPKKFFKKSSLSKTIKPKKEPSINSNAKYLLIVESPSKCSKIEGFLGDEYCCIASKGHIRTIEGLKSIDTKNTFEPKFSIIDEKKGHIECMRSIISKFSKSNIILASDDDREGEAIAWHICEVFDLPIQTSKRIIFHEITKTAIVNAVKNPTTINMNLVHAQHARQVLDMIVGYKISPYLWRYLYFNKSNSLSAGRCQTPALRLVYDNHVNKKSELEIKYKTFGNFTSNNVIMTLNYEFETQEKIMDFLTQSKEFEHIIKVGSTKKSVKQPPKPLNTSKLLQLANNVLHISPKETMNICQTLYQNGHITYMRTDSTKYSKDFLNKAEEYIIKKWEKPEYVGKLDTIEQKDINNPHEAIRVTNINMPYLSDCENAHMSSLYRLLWRNSIESCMAEAVYNSTEIKVSAPLEKYYLYHVEVPLFQGWKIVKDKKDVDCEKDGKDSDNKDTNKKETKQKKDTQTDKQNNPSSLLMFFQSLDKSGKPIQYNYLESNVVVRNKQQHYTEASLINKLEELGIGRPSTFATIIETIQERGYVKRMDVEGEKIKCIEYKLRNNGNKGIIETKEEEKTFGNEKNKLVIQPLGVITIDFLLKYFQQLFSYDYTKQMEDNLDNVSSGQENEWAKLCKNCYNEIKELSKELTTLTKQVYPIDDTHDYIFEKFGPVIRHKLEDGTFEYKQAKKDMKIDFEKLKNREYTLNELYEIKNDCLGKYEGEDLFIKNGKYGVYVEWGDKKESIKKIEKPMDEITLQDIIDYLGTDKTQTNKSVIRILTPELSIRKGKFGAYAFYKREDMPAPEFYNIKKFPESYISCDLSVLIEWLKETYKIAIDNTK